jgi:hypothetical protein
LSKSTLVLRCGELSIDDFSEISTAFTTGEGIVSTSFESAPQLLRHFRSAISIVDRLSGELQ